MRKTYLSPNIFFMIQPNNLKAKNIITSALGMDEYLRVSNCKSAKDMWDTLQVTHEREQLMSKDLG